jgi:hypothetical protein
MSGKDFQGFSPARSGQHIVSEALEDGFAHFEPERVIIDTKQHELAKPSQAAPT